MDFFFAGYALISRTYGEKRSFGEKIIIIIPERNVNVISVKTFVGICVCSCDSLYACKMYSMNKKKSRMLAPVLCQCGV